MLLLGPLETLSLSSLSFHVGTLGISSATLIHWRLKSRAKSKEALINGPEEQSKEHGYL